MITINTKKSEPIFCKGNTKEEQFLSSWLQNDIQADCTNIEKWLNDLNMSSDESPVLSGGNCFLVDCLSDNVVLCKEQNGEKISYSKHVIRKALLEWRKACISPEIHYKKSFTI